MSTSNEINKIKVGKSVPMEVSKPKIGKSSDISEVQRLNIKNSQITESPKINVGIIPEQLKPKPDDAPKDPPPELSPSVHTHNQSSISGLTDSLSSIPSPATTVVSETTFGLSPAVGTKTKNFALEDHEHGTPPTPSTAVVNIPLVNSAAGPNFTPFAIPANAIAYGFVVGNGIGPNAEATVGLRMPAGIVKRLLIHIGTTNLDSDSTIRLRKNGQDTALVATMTANTSNTDFTDDVHTVTLALNDVIDWKIVTVGTGGQTMEISKIQCEFSST